MNKLGILAKIEKVEEEISDFVRALSSGNVYDIAAHAEELSSVLKQTALGLDTLEGLEDVEERLARIRAQ